MSDKAEEKLRQALRHVPPAGKGKSSDDARLLAAELRTLLTGKRAEKKAVIEPALSSGTSTGVATSVPDSTTPQRSGDAQEVEPPAKQYKDIGGSRLEKRSASGGSEGGAQSPKQSKTRPDSIALDDDAAAARFSERQLSTDSTGSVSSCLSAVIVIPRVQAVPPAIPEM